MKGCVIFILVILLMPGVFAALGIGPAKTEVNFQSGLEFSADFITVGAGEEQKLEIYSAGEFSEYVTFDKTIISGGEGFQAKVKLPQEAANPGPNRLRIGVREIQEGGGMIGTRLAVEAAIIINVPYPGKYAQLSITGNDANEGEPVTLTVSVKSLGKETITPNVKINLYADNKTIEEFNLGTSVIEPQGQESFSKTITNLKTGDYVAEAVADYGDIIKKEASFRVGSLMVNVVNWTREVEQGKISKFEIEVESRWNSRIENVYAEVNVTQQGEEKEFFKTPSSAFGPWEKKMLSGYMNAENIESGDYQASISVFYDGKNTMKNIEIKVFGANQRTIIIIAASIIMIIIAALVIWKRTRKDKNEKIKGNRKK